MISLPADLVDWLVSSAHLSSECSVRTNDLVKDVLANVRVHCTERVIHEVDISLLVHCTGQTHSLLLTSTQVDPL